MPFSLYAGREVDMEAGVRVCDGRREGANHFQPFPLELEPRVVWMRGVETLVISV